MRIDFEELALYTGLHHQVIDALVNDAFLNDLQYSAQINNVEWFYKTSPYYIFDVMTTRNTGLYEIIYDYIKRRIDRKSTIFDYGAGVGTLAVNLLKRSPAAIVVDELNLQCMDFINWRFEQKKKELSFPLLHYDYVVSLDTLQRLEISQIKPTLKWLLASGDRCFIYVNDDSRYPFYEELPFNLEKYLKAHSTSVKNFYGLWDVVINERTD